MKSVVDYLAVNGKAVSNEFLALLQVQQSQCHPHSTANGKKYAVLEHCAAPYYRVYVVGHTQRVQCNVPHTVFRQVGR